MGTNTTFGQLAIQEQDSAPIETSVYKIIVPNGSLTIVEPGIASLSYGAPGTAIWGGISGDITDQTDLQTALSARQPLNANLTSLAALGTTNDRLAYTTGVDTWAETPLTSFARTILDDADAGAVRATIGAAPLASPTFTGTPAAPTAIAGTNTTQLATTAFVGTAIANLVNSSPATLDTLKELADALGDDPNFSTTVSTALGNRLRVDTNAQGLTSTQKDNARTNLGIAIADAPTFAGLTLTGQVLLPNGSDAAPAIAFSSEPDTGFRWNASGQFFACTNGVRRYGWSDTEYQLRSGNVLNWSSGNIAAASDTGLARSAAGTVKVTNGSTGYGTLDALALSVGGTSVVNSTRDATVNSLLVNAATANLYLKDTSTGFQAASTTVVTLQANNSLRSISYTSGAVGFNMNSSTGSAEFNNLDVRGAIHAGVLVYNAMLATSGTIGIFKAAAKLRTDVIIPSGPTYNATTVNIDVVDQDGLTHAASQLFAVNDAIFLRDGGSVTGLYVQSVSDQTTFWRYVCVIAIGTANVTYRAGLGVADYGPSGQGYITMTADQTNAPYMQMQTHAGFGSIGASGVLTVIPRVRVGNLNGSYGYSADLYGFGAGRYGASGETWITVETTNGIRIGNNTTQLAQWKPSGDILVGQETSGQSNVYISSGGVSIRNNTTERIGLNSSGVMTVKDSSGNAVLTFDASAGAEITKKLTMPGASSAIAIGSTPPTSATVGTGIWIDRTGMYGLASNVQQVIFNAVTGKVTAGATILDSNGISVLAGTAYTVGSSYKHVGADGSTILTDFWTQEDTTFGIKTAFLNVPSRASYDSYIEIASRAPSGRVAQVGISNYVNSVLMSGLRLRGDGATLITGNLGIGSSAMVFGTSAVSVLGIKNGTEPATSPIDMVQLYSVDLSAGNATLGLRTETSVVTESVTSDRTLSIRVNGVTYKLLLKS